MKYKKSVHQSLVLVTQFGITMLVPIFLCTFLGLWLDKLCSVNFLVIPFFFLGTLAGFRNVYRMAKQVYQNEEEIPENEKDENKTRK